MMDDKSGGEEERTGGQGRPLHLRGHRWLGRMLFTSLHSLSQDLWCCPWLMGSTRPNGPIEAFYPDHSPAHPSHVPPSKSRYCMSHLLAPLRFNPSACLNRPPGAARAGFSISASISDKPACWKACQTKRIKHKVSSHPHLCRAGSFRLNVSGCLLVFIYCKSELCWLKGSKWLVPLFTYFTSDWLYPGSVPQSKNDHQWLINMEPMVRCQSVICAISSILRPAVTNGCLPALCSPCHCSQMQQPDAHSLSATLLLQYLSLP